MIEQLVEDDCRNQLIISRINDLADKGLNVFVFSDRRAHVEHLADMLCKDMVIVYGGSNEDVIQLAKHDAQIVLTTYGYSSTGVSIDRMTGLVLATPMRSKAVQIAGRIFRQNPEYQDCKRHIVDIVDNCTVLKSQLSGRLLAYRDRQASIRETVVSYEEINNTNGI